MVKQATKGQKEIFEENKTTIAAYTVAAVVSSLVYLLGCQLLWQCNTTSYVFFGVTIVVQLAAIAFMRRLAAARVDEKGHVFDAGADLNDPEAFGEYCKDCVILTVAVQVVALYTNYGYLLLLVIPSAAFYKLFFGLILPYLTASSAETEVDDKKVRKMDRRREKVVYRR